MAFLSKWLRGRFPRLYTPVRLDFPKGGFEVVPQDEVFEEEHMDDFKAGIYYAVEIGDVYDSKYQVVGKLGFGSTSTVWLARRLDSYGHVALKVFTQLRDKREFEISRALSNANPLHPGFKHIRKALDIFILPRQGGDHYCLVQKPTWDSWRAMLRWNPTHRFTPMLLKAGLKQVFLAIDYLHNECNLIHTDIKADNILNEIADESILEAFTKAELTQPSRRKYVNNTPISASRTFQRPRKLGNIVLSDFGAAVRGDKKRNHEAQPEVYTSPEVMLKAGWSYEIDIWNVGTMFWDLFEGKHLFYGKDIDGKGYSTRAHLGEVIALLGAPPLDLFQRGNRSGEFF